MATDSIKNTWYRHVRLWLYRRILIEPRLTSKSLSPISRYIASKNVAILPDDHEGPRQSIFFVGPDGRADMSRI